MATAEIKTKITLELQEEEAIFLRALVQNSCYAPSSNEPDVERKPREAIFNALQSVLLEYPE